MKRPALILFPLMFLFISHTSFAQSLVLQLPFSNQEVYRISRGYGTDSHINKDFYALDFADPKGNPNNIFGKVVLATATGKVSKVNKIDKYGGGYGYNVEVDHGNNYFSRYAHFSRVANIELGQSILTGDVLGFVGNTGHVEPTPNEEHPYWGTHLHFVIYTGKLLYDYQQDKTSYGKFAYKPEPISGCTDLVVDRTVPDKLCRDKQIPVQISKPLSSDENKETPVSVQPSNPPDKQKLPATPKPTLPPAPSQTQQEPGLIKSEFFRNDKTAKQIITGERTSVDIRTFTDDINLIQKGISNSPELFEYKVISALRMLGMSRPDLTSSGYFIGEMLLNKFQKLHGLEISPFVTANVLRKIDIELAFREQKDKELAQRFPLYSRFTESLPNQPTREHVVALYTLAFEALPPHLVQWDAKYFESFLRAQLRDFIVNPNNNEWRICTGEWWIYGVVSRPCPTKISVQEGQVVGFWDELNLIDALVHEYAHFLDKSVGYSHALTIDTAGFNSISFFKNNPEGYTTKNPEEYYRRKQLIVYATEFVTQYAVNSPREDFAESFVMYVSQGKVFRELANGNQYLREKYDWLKKNVFNGVEYNTGDIRGISIWQRSIEVNKNYFESQPLGPIISMPSHPATYSLVIPEYIFEYAFLRL